MEETTEIMSGTVDFIVRSYELNPIRQFAMAKGQAQTITFDYSPWAEDFGTVTAVTVAVKSGDVSIGTESIASSKKTFVITASNAGQNMIKLTSTAGNNTHVMHLRVMVRDPDIITNDYGFFT